MTDGHGTTVAAADVISTITIGADRKVLAWHDDRDPTPLAAAIDEHRWAHARERTLRGATSRRLT